MKRLLLLLAAALALSAILPRLWAAAADGSWLRRVPATERSRTTPLLDPDSAAEAGAHLYGNHCASCHGETGLGKASRPAVVSDRVRGASDGELAWLLKNGNTWHGMPSWNALPDQQRWQLVAYLRRLNDKPRPGAENPQAAQKSLP